MRLILVLLTALSLPVSAQVYKWTDENGNVHFGQAPPPGQQEEVKIRDTRSSDAATPVESDIIRRARELERKQQAEAAERRYQSRSQEVRAEYEDRPDYICTGAENRLKSAKERWDAKKRQGYKISDENYYEQLIASRQRHRDNVCR